MAHSLISIGALLILPMLRTWFGAPLIDRIGALLLLALWLAFALAIGFAAIAGAQWLARLLRRAAGGPARR